MRNWQEDLLKITDSVLCERAVFSECAVFKEIESAARSLGFEHCAYGFRRSLPITNPKTILLNNYPVGWKQRYVSEDYLKTDPTVLHGLRTQVPLVWNDHVFASQRKLWEEAQSFGLRVGWAQSSLGAIGTGGMLTLSRSCEALTQSELLSKEIKLRWLTTISHQCLSRIFISKQVEQTQPFLTAREIEVLKWTADGKTSGEISDILTVSENTVNFHIKNAVGKLQTSNKTAAVVRAVMLGLLWSAPSP